MPRIVAEEPGPHVIDSRKRQLLSPHLLKTGYPPKQLLKFTLDDMRYTVQVVRQDLVATPMPAK